MNPEDLLTDTLHDRVERTDYPSTPLSAVAGRAGAIRARRRRTTALAAAAAVAVVTVPGALWLGHTPDRSAQPGGTLTSGPTTQPTAHSGNPMVLAALPLGAKPGIDYLVDDTYVDMAGGRTTDPALRTAITATPVRGGLLFAVRAAAPAVARLWLHSQQGDQTLGCGSDRFAMSTDGVESAYWLGDSCQVGPTVAGALYSGVNNTMGESGPGHVATPAGSRVTPVGIVGQGVVANVVRGRTQTVQVVDTAGQMSPLPLAFAGGSDENNDVVSGQLAGASTTGAVVSASTGAVVWRAPGWALGQFSDDGKYVAAQQLANPQVYAILDATTGHVIARLDTIGAYVTIEQVAWDFDDTLLAVANDGHDEAIIRWDLQGHATRATATRQVRHLIEVYRLATRP
jgi:hypothetical protein